MKRSIGLIIVISVILLFSEQSLGRITLYDETASFYSGPLCQTYSICGDQYKCCQAPVKHEGNYYYWNCSTTSHVVFTLAPGINSVWSPGTNYPDEGPPFVFTVADSNMTVYITTLPQNRESFQLDWHVIYNGRSWADHMTMTCLFS